MKIIMYSGKKRDKTSLGFKNVQDGHFQTRWNGSRKLMNMWVAKEVRGQKVTGTCMFKA